MSEFEENQTEAISEEPMSETGADEAVALDSKAEAELIDKGGDVRDSDASDLKSDAASQENDSDMDVVPVDEPIAEDLQSTASPEKSKDIAVPGPDEPVAEEESKFVNVFLPETQAKPLADEENDEELDQAAKPAEEPDDGRHWYVVHCYSGYENKVRHNLEQRIETMNMKTKIFDVVVPTEEEIEVKDGKRRTVERRVFPGYILVQMLMDEDSWYVVRNTPGVTGFVGMGNDPTPLRPEEVSSIVKRMEAEAPRIKVTYKAGQKVRIIDGPFNDFIGTVADIDMERAKVRVMVSFFGRETPVELDFLQVEKA